MKKGAIYRDGPGRLGGSRGISGRGGHEQDGGDVGRWGRKVFCKSLQAKVGCGQGAPAGGQILKEDGEVLCRRSGEQGADCLNDLRLWEAMEGNKMGGRY